MTTLREAAQQALEACEQRLPLKGQAAIIDELNNLRAALVEDAMQKFTDVNQELEAALAEDVVTHGSAWSKDGKHIDPTSVYADPVQEPVAWEQFHEHMTGPFYRAPPQRPAEPVQEPVANRAFLERILTAMEGVIDVADRKTDEFDALRSCVIDLTMMLHTAPPQRKPLTEEEIYKMYNALWRAGGTEAVAFARAIERAHDIGENT